ncbi:R3H domain-containing nucleic acid-binding protein [Granulicella sp. S190]|uniref:Jag family protein n=1 Tax=Granulicella sp. S190 TaxID=1747226 RepID=UPI0020B14953|nr:R3H domain-containing nucleic acid-binding protein [Granulicella sp. S190]
MMTNPFMDQGHAVKKVRDFLKVLTDTGSFDLQSNILACNGHVQPSPDAPVSADSPVSTGTPQTPLICVEFTGRDTSLLLARNGELLHALEHVAAKILRLEPEEHDLIFFDAEGFKAKRDRELHLSAETAIEQVRATNRPYSFPPMTSRERRMLHLALAKSGLPTASSGEGPRRFVILYPDGPVPTTPESPQTAERTRAIQNSFRRR